MAGVLVVAEQRDGALKKPVLESIAEGRRQADSLGGELSVLLIGDPLAGLEAQPTRLGADRVLMAADPRLKLYAPAAYARVAADAAKQAGADLILLAASSMGRDLAARLAARLGAGLAADCTGLNATPQEITAR